MEITYYCIIFFTVQGHQVVLRNKDCIVLHKYFFQDFNNANDIKEYNEFLPTYMTHKVMAGINLYQPMTTITAPLRCQV